MSPTNDDDPVTLQEACDIVFRGRITPATLRAEAGRGKITIAKIGKRYFTTLREARELFDRCHAEPEARTSTSTRAADSGSSETDNASSARAAANATVEMLKGLSKPTSGGSTGRNRQLRH